MSTILKPRFFSPAGHALPCVRKYVLFPSHGPPPLAFAPKRQSILHCCTEGQINV